MLEVSGSIQAQIEKSEYDIHWQPAAGAYMAPNRAHNLRFTFHDNGLTVTPRQPAGGETPWVAALSLDSYGRTGCAGKRVGAASWSIVENTGQIDSDGISIAYRNDKEGLRQEFLIQERPPGAGPLRLDFLVERKGLKMNLDAAQNLIHFTKLDDVSVIQYRDLNVFDANQQPVAVRMVQVDADRFAIVVDDQAAEYPVLVDPMLIGDGYLNEPAGQLFGYSVAYIDYFQLNPEEDMAPLGGTPGNGGGLLVGAPHFDSGSYVDAGEVCFYDPYGGALPTTPTWSYAGTQANELLGWCVADGGANLTFSQYGSTYHNILVGAPGYSAPKANAIGAALAFYPDQTTGVYPSSPNWKVTGSLYVPGSGFGTSVAGDVDFNGDGYGDVVVGVPNGSVPNGPIQDASEASSQTSWSGYGFVNIYLGTGTGYNTTPGWSESGASGSGFGFSVEWGLVQGLSYLPALIVGAPGVNSSSGAVYEFLNPSGTLHTSPDVTLNGQSGGDQFGYALGSRADQNHDGFQDLLVGAPNATVNSYAGAGKVYLYQGSPSGLPTTAAWVAGVNSTNASFGTSVALGDMNLDGYADVIIGEPNMSAYNLVQNGFVNLYLTDPGTGLPHYAYTVAGLYSYVNLGTSVAYGRYLVNAGPDLIVGVPGGSITTPPSVELFKWSP